jgi:hypothetical protein
LLTEALIRVGAVLLRRIFPIDVATATDGIQRGDEFDTAVRLLRNAVRAVAGVVTWILLWIAVWIPWQVLSAAFRAPHPRLSRAIADLGGGLASFVAAGFCLYMLRMAIALTLAQRETPRASGRVDDAVGGNGVLSTPPPSVGIRLAIAATVATDLDFLFETLIGGLVLVALVNHAQAQGYPL